MQTFEKNNRSRENDCTYNNIELVMRKEDSE